MKDLFFLYSQVQEAVLYGRFFVYIQFTNSNVLHCFVYVHNLFTGEGVAWLLSVVYCTWCVLLFTLSRVLILLPVRSYCGNSSGWECQHFFVYS